MCDGKLLLCLLLEEIEEEEEVIIEELLKRNAAVHPMFETREEEGFFSVLVNRHLSLDDLKFREFFRLNRAQFNFVLALINDQIQTQSCNKYPHPITPEKKLAITLRFMATGESFRSLAFALRVSYSYISKIVEATLSALVQKLKPIFLPLLSKEDLETKAQEFQEKWQFPNCVGAIDGKHVRVVCPSNSGSLFFNYKNYFSIVLLAVVDANYKFIFIDVGSYGKEGDSGTFDKSELGRKFSTGEMFPPPKKLPNSDIVLPHVFVGDEAFRLHPNMMKPFSKPVATADQKKAIFNYRLSRARRISENAFALKSQVFRVFYTPIALKPETTDNLIVVSCCLHNLQRDAYLESNTKPYYELDTTQVPPSENFTPLARGGGFANADGFAVRNLFTEYVNSRAGQVPWQRNYVSRTR